MLPKFLTNLLKRFGSSSQKKIAFVLLFFFLFSTLLSKPIQAFYTPDSTYQFQFEHAIYGVPEEMNLQSFVYEVLKAVIGSVFMKVSRCFTCEPGTGETGMINTVSTFIAFLYTSPPASGVQYLADLGKRIGIVQPTYAQEDQTGFGKMKAYRDIWKAFRNLTYVFFVLILVIMGFAIMFRVKISPQTVISIQSALPKVIIALILITFSYAIVGLLVDFMFVAANLALFTFGDLIGIFDWAEKVGYDLAITSDVKAFGILFLAGLFPSLATLIFFMILPTLVGSIFAPLTAGATLGLGLAIDLLILVILAIVFLIAMIRVFWSLLKAYVMVVVNLIFAPFQILIGVLPGSNAIANWFRNLIANLAVFPAILTMLLLSFYLVYHALTKMNLFETVVQVLTNQISWIEFIGLLPSNGQSPEVLGVLGEMTVLCFISLGILLMTPKVSDMIKAFFAGKPFEYGTAIGEAFGPVRGGAGLVIMGGAPTVAERIVTRGEGRPEDEPPSMREKALAGVIETVGKKISG